MRSTALAAAAVALPPLLARVAPTVMTPTLGFAIATAACFAAMALSLDIVAGHAGQFTLGHGAVISVGALASGVLTAKWHLPFLAGAGGGTVVGAAVSWALARPAVRLGPLSLGAVTLALAAAVDSTLFRWDWLTAGRESMVLPRPLVGMFRFAASADYAAVATCVALIALAVDLRIRRSGFGRQLHVVRDDERLAAALGIDPLAAKRRAFVVAGALGGLAGSAYGHLLITVGPETFGFARLSLPLLALVVIAGQGAPVAVAAVGAGYGLMPRVLHPLEEWAALVGALLFLNAVARNPEGLSSTVNAARRRRRERRAAPEDAPVVLPLVSSLPAASASTSRSLVLEGVHVTVDGSVLLDEMTMEVDAGSIVALVGPNGAGKTTTLNAISGLVAISRGSITVDGTELTDRPPHARRGLGVARTFQGGSLPGRIDVEEALMLGQVGAGAQARDRAGQIAHALGLDHRLDVPVRELSVGQQRLLEVVATITCGAGVLLLDEPSAGLAQPVVDALAERLTSARDDLGRTILLVEHNLRLVRAVADVVCVLDRGRVVHTAPATEFFAPGAPTVLTWVGGTQ